MVRPLLYAENMRVAISLLIILMALALLPVSHSASNPAISNVSASWPAFNSLAGQEVIYYSWYGPSNGSLAVVIVDDRAMVSRVINASSRDPGRHNITWDGRDGSGSPAREGRYTVWLLSSRSNPQFSYRQPFSLPRGVDNTSVNVTVDNTPPVTRLTLSGDREDNGNYTGTVEAQLNAMDVLSGVNATEYSLDGAPWARYGSAIAIGEGEHTLAYRSTDRAGNTEAARTVPVNVSSTGPPPASSGPQVTDTAPTDGDIDMILDPIIMAWFDRDMDENSINADTFRLWDGNGNYVSGLVDYDGAAVFIPDSSLLPHMQYTASIRNARDLNGKAMADEYAWRFTTGDPTESAEVGDFDPPEEMIYDDNASSGEQVVDASLNNSTEATDGMPLEAEAEPYPEIENITGDNASIVPAPAGQQPPRATPEAYMTLALPIVFVIIAHWHTRRKK